MCIRDRFKTIALLSVFLKFSDLIEVPLAPDTKYKVTLDNILTDPPFNICLLYTSLRGRCLHRYF